jgi:alkaline phosphatase
MFFVWIKTLPMKLILFLIWHTLFLSGIPALSQNGQQTKPKRAKNIILLIGDGMGVSQIQAGLTANKGNLHLLEFPVTGFSLTEASDQYVTDSGAGATALSIGRKTYNGAIGVDATGAAQETILETAEKKGLATGLVATCSITHATPASFIAHQAKRSLEEAIALDFLKTEADVFIGGGLRYFTQRQDGRNLLEELRSKGYQTLADTTADMRQLGKGKLAALTADLHPPKMTEGRGDYLIRATQTALQILKQQPKGFFVMIEGSQIDWGGHANDTRYVTSEMIDFDQAIGEALRFARQDKNTLVIVTADHETGGMSLTAGSTAAGTVEARFTTGGHTGVMVPVFAFGPGAEAFSGIYPNTAIYTKMMQALGFTLPDTHPTAGKNNSSSGQQ